MREGLGRLLQDKSGLKLVFMGTPDFAVPSLNSIIESPYDVAAVVTQPDRPKGRIRVPVPSPVKSLATKQRLEVLQPQSVKEKGFVQRLRALNPDLIVIVAYGQILPKVILDMPPLGCVNVHASLLPKYRGASPIQWAIIEGEKETGITTMLIDEGMDSGPILLSERIAIKDEDNCKSLHKRLSLLGAEMLMRTIELMREGRLEPAPQDHSIATYAPLLRKEDGLISWEMDAIRIKNLIRALNPWPGTYTQWKDKRLKILDGIAIKGSAKEAPGTVVKRGSDGIMVATKKGYLLITIVQPENKRSMKAEEFLRGYDLKNGEKLAS